jgi:hypothetical protein
MTIETIDTMCLPAKHLPGALLYALSYIIACGMSFYVFFVED